MQARSALPNRAFWMINAACPSRCVYCSVESQLGKGSLEAEEARHIARQLLEAGFTEVVFGGGEPLLAPALPAALEVLAGRCDVAVFTGGVPGRVERSLELIRHGVSRLVFSLDHGDEAENDRLRGRAGTTRDQLALLAAVRRELPRMDVSVNTVVSRHNVDALPSVWERVRGFRPQGWSLTLAGDNFTGSPAEHFLSREQLERFFFDHVPTLAALLSGTKTDFIVLPVPLPFLEGEVPHDRWASEAPRHRAALDRELELYAQGAYNQSFVETYGCPLVGIDVLVGVGAELHPCSQFPIIQPEYVVGSLRRASLSELVAGEEMAAFRAQVPHAPCRRCWAPSNIPPAMLRGMVRARRGAA